MRTGENPDNAQPQAEEFDHDADRHPDARTALRRLLEEGNLPEGPTERIEINTLANGEFAYRIFEARSEAYYQGHIAEPA